MPGFIRQKAALPHRETAPARAPAAKKAAPSKKRSAPVDLTSSPVKATSKKRPSPDSPTSSSEDTTTNDAKKTRTTSPLPTASKSTTSAPQSPPHASSLPSSLPANGQDYIHDPSGLLPQLMDSYNVCTMQIISSSKMSSKIARSLDTLVLGKINMADVKCKPGLVVMYAKAGVAGKLVSVVEVVKREIGQKGEIWYQYNALGETMVVIPRKSPKSEKGGKKEDAMDLGKKDEEEDEDTYFETMKTKQERVLEGTDRMRAVPVLTVYLSRVPIEKLKVKYGEQSNAKK